MKMVDYIEDIKLELTAGVLELEIPDNTLTKYVERAFREINKYIDETRLITVPYSACIDMKDFKYKTVTAVYRTEGIGDGMYNNSNYIDPMAAQVWLSFTNGGTMYNLNSYVMNYATYNNMLQIRNTISTDLAFYMQKDAQKLYINCSNNTPMQITIEYIPVFEKVEDITSEYWQDILYKMSLALVKIALGRLRTRFTQSNALWTQDGETLLAEGSAELEKLRDSLNDNLSMFYPID